MSRLSDLLLMRMPLFGVPVWSIVAPVLACAVLVVAWGQESAVGLIVLLSAVLVVTVITAVHHAEVVALRVGEPFGTLTLALAVTVIEVALIVSFMLSGRPAAALTRDTVFATVMIVCNGVVGLSLLVGAIRHQVLVFRVEGTSSALSVLASLTTLTLVLPAVTISEPGPIFSPSQLVFAGVTSVALYGVFVFVQTVRHREYFLPIGDHPPDQPAAPPSLPVTFLSLGLLLLCLVAVVGLAKTLAPSIEAGVDAIGAPPAVVGIAIALLVLLPESAAALRAAGRNQMQTSFNLALGSALATIGLTIPTVAVVSLLLKLPLVLGLSAKDIVMLVLTLLVSTMTMARGRATVLQGAVHLVLFATYIFLAIVP